MHDGHGYLLDAGEIFYSHMKAGAETQQPRADRLTVTGGSYDYAI